MDFESRLQTVYQTFLTPGAAVIDVGAHVVKQRKETIVSNITQQ